MKETSKMKKYIISPTPKSHWFFFKKTIVTPLLGVVAISSLNLEEDLCKDDAQ